MIHRSNYKKIIESLSKQEITIIIGARQVGKTTISQKVCQDLKEQGKKVLYLNLDIESDFANLNTQRDLLNKIKLEFGDSFGYVFIDEIQQKEDAGRFLKGIYDMNLPYKFIVTGSGSLELKEKVGEALTGRKYMLNMHTLSFKGFINYRTNYKYKDKLDDYCSVEKDKTHDYLQEYLAFGGYPKVVTSNNIQTKLDAMNEIFTSYISKDIAYLLGVRSPQKFVKLIKLLAVQSGGIINYSQLASDTNISVDTLKNYLWYAEQTFIISIVKPYFTNSKKELVKSPTVYFNDIGMLNFGTGIYGNQHIHNGFVFQNFIYKLLQNKYETEINKINYWRTKDKAEVDFVIHELGNTIPIEVKFTKLKKTEISRSFHSFINKYSPKKAIIVNLDLETEIIIKETTVSFIPYWKLL